MLLKIKAILEINPVHKTINMMLKSSMICFSENTAAYQIILTPPDEVG